MGSGIKIFALILFAIGVIGGMICILIGIFGMQQNRIPVEYGIYGITAAIVGVLPLYWFGCLFETVEDTKREIEELRIQIGGNNKTITGTGIVAEKELKTWLMDNNKNVQCPKCGKQMSFEFISVSRVCPQCGQEFRGATRK